MCSNQLAPRFQTGWTSIQSRREAAHNPRAPPESQTVDGPATLRGFADPALDQGLAEQGVRHQRCECSGDGLGHRAFTRKGGAPLVDPAVTGQLVRPRPPVATRDHGDADGRAVAAGVDYRSAVTGRLFNNSTVARHPNTTTRRRARDPRSTDAASRSTPLGPHNDHPLITLPLVGSRGDSEHD